MTLNSQFELSKIGEKQEFQYETLENGEKKDNFSLPLSKKSRVERELFLAILENREQKEKWDLSIFRDR